MNKEEDQTEEVEVQEEPVEEVEEEVIAKDFNDSDISLEGSINELDKIIDLNMGLIKTNTQ